MVLLKTYDQTANQTQLQRTEDFKCCI